MNPIFDEIRSFLKLAQPSKHLYLIHDRQGKVVEVLTQPSGLLATTGSIIQERGTLAQFFNLSRISEKEPVIISQNPGTNLVQLGLGLRTLLPQHSLHTVLIAPDRYLGRVSMYEFQILPAAQSFYYHIFVDHRTDILLGFTDGFYEFFQKPYDLPEKMLGLPVDRFFEPSPLQYQRSMLASFDPVRETGFSSRYRRAFPAEPPDESVEISGLKIGLEPGGLSCESSQGQQGFLTLPVNMNTTKEDFVLEVVVDILEGEGPYFILGHRNEGEENLPDERGYTAGPSVGVDPENMFWLIKRNGFVIHSIPIGPVSTVTKTFHFVKVGKSILFFLDGKKKLGYYDADFVHPGKAFVSLGIRKGNRCHLKQINLKTRPAAVDPHDRPVVKLSGDTERLFWMEPFYHPALSQPTFYHVTGYMLNDITEMEKRIQVLNFKYKSLLKQTSRESRIFIGDSPPANAVRNTAKLAAASNATVLIEGPTGSGKEVMAHYIHEQSHRKNGPFVKVDCATIPPSLIESHLFGHEKGAFTGAVGRNIGMLEAANKGTLFLDEIGNLTPDVQAKLLQFLNDFTITRLGGTKVFHLDVRVIGASNVNLEEQVRTGRFRQDLYYRLNVVYLKMPSLSARKEDIATLSRYFLLLFATEQGKKTADFTPEAIRKLEAHAWAGNIRELSNVIQRAVIFCDGEKVGAELINFLNQNETRKIERSARMPFVLSHTSESDIIDALKAHHGRAKAAAKGLGMGRATLYKFLKEHQIKPGDYKRGFKLRGDENGAE